MGLSHGPSLAVGAMGSLLRSAHGLFFLLSVQAVEGRPVPKAKIAEEPKIKETLLHLFYPHHCYGKCIAISNIF